MDNEKKPRIGRLQEDIFGEGAKEINEANGLEPEPKNPQDDSQQLIKPWANWGKNTRWGEGQPVPTTEQKKAGWAKRKRNQALARLVLGMKFVGIVQKTDKNGNPVFDKDGNPEMVDSIFKQRLATYFGMSPEQIEATDNEMALMLRQVGQAIELGDQAAANLILNRAYGTPQPHIDVTDEEGQRPVINITVVEQLEFPIIEIEQEDDNSDNK